MRKIVRFFFLLGIVLLISACALVTETVEEGDGARGINATATKTLMIDSPPSESQTTMTLDPNRPRETNTAILTITPRPTSTLRPSSTSEQTATPAPTVDPEGVLSATGPWLLYSKSTGENHHLAVNMDGSGRSIVNIPEGISSGPIFSPGGFQMAYVVDGPMEGDRKLIVARFPDGKIEGEIALFSPDWQANYRNQPYSDEAIQTIQAVGKMRWSPGGRYLAFVAALHGLSSDLYVFDLSTKEVRHLTNGPYRTRIMGWSPDGEWIVHQSVKHFGTGAGISGDAVWAAALDGSEVRYLYNAPREQTLAGWMDTQKFVVYEWGQPYGAMNILRVSIENGEPLLVYEGPLGSMSWNNLRFNFEEGAAIFILTKYEAQESLPRGVYITSIQYQMEPVLILPGDWEGLSCRTDWEECFVIGVSQEEVAGFTLDGEVRFFAEGSSTMKRVVPSPGDNLFVAYNEQGAWLYDWEGTFIRQILSEGVEEFLWELDGKTFYFLDHKNGILYMGNPVNEDLFVIDTGVVDMELVR